MAVNNTDRDFDDLDFEDEQRPADRAAHDSDDHAYSEVLAEIDAQVHKKPSWINAIVLLVVSGLLFAGAGAANWDWKITLLLIPILLFHELGHLLAMIAFRYSNLRMFFIPFFGAAVTGQHYNVAGWKKAIVSLAGPVPGIGLAIVLGIVGLVMKIDLLVEAAMLMLVLNGLNLLPVLPLDGGWVMHSILFVRHYVFDVSFRVLAALALMVGGFASGDRILLYMGIPMLMGIPAAYHASKIASKLRQYGLPSDAPAGETIPRETAVAIIDEVRAAYPRGLNNKNTARITLNVFEAMNARVPGIMASLALCCAYGASLIVAVVALSVFVVAKHADMGQLMNQLAFQPQHEFECGQTQTWNGKDFAGPPPKDETTIVATFAGHDEAQKAFDELQNQFPSTSQATLFGQSLMLSLPGNSDADREKWLATLESRAEKTFVQSDTFRTQLFLTCIAPNEHVADEIDRAANEYFRVGNTAYLVPPWHPVLTISEKDQRARKTFIEIQDAENDFYADPQYMPILEQMGEARRRGDKNKVKQLTDERTRLRKEFHKGVLDRIRSKGPAEVDLAVIDTYATRPEAKADEEFKPGMYDEWTHKLGAHMGQLPLVDGKPSHVDLRYSAATGSSTKNGFYLRFTLTGTDRPSDGVLAFTNWLCKQGCVSFKYDLDGFEASEDLE